MPVKAKGKSGRTRDSAVLRQIVAGVLRCSDPDRIVLFGSRARGQARPDSDYDILVVERSRCPRYRRAGQLYGALADLPVEVEVMVYRPYEIRQWKQVPRAFVTTALREGKVLYEKKR